MRTVLTIAGSDSSGGAGIQADLKTMEALGVYGMSVITALTAQNTMAVFGVSPVDADFVALQLKTVFEDIRPDAVKVGMLPDIDVMKAVKDALLHYKPESVVLDPVLSSTSGTELTRLDALEYMKKELFCQCTLITPNIPEAETLSGITIQDKEDMVKAVAALGDSFCCSVLLKGGHSSFDKGRSLDLLYHEGVTTWFEGERLDNPNTHGTGCTLSSAIACNLALGKELKEAIALSKNYISACISEGLNLGKGRGPLEHRAKYELVKIKNAKG